MCYVLHVLLTQMCVPARAHSPIQYSIFGPADRDVWFRTLVEGLFLTDARASLSPSIVKVSRLHVGMLVCIVQNAHAL